MEGDRGISEHSSLNSNFSVGFDVERPKDVNLLDVSPEANSSALEFPQLGSHPTTKKGENSTPDLVFAFQSIAVAIFFTGVGLHFYSQWSPAVLCFAIAFFLDILVTHIAAWTGHNSDFSYELYRTLALLSFRSILIYLVITKVTKYQVIFLGAWNFFDITATILMFMACDLVNNVSYETKQAHYLTPLRFVYGNPEAKFALEYGVMFFLVATYELTMNGEMPLKEGDYAGFSRNGDGGGLAGIYAKLKGVLLIVTLISAGLFIWDGLNNVMMLAEAIGFFTGPWKNEVCNE